MESVWRTFFGVFRTPRVVVSVMALAVLVGCSDTPYDIVRISGKVTYQDGSLIPADTIYLKFYPQVQALSPKVRPRPGSAELNTEDGTFAVVSTVKYGDGVIPGRHKVTVKVSEESETGADAIPKTYADPATTPLEIEVTRRNRYFELTVEKPRGGRNRR